MLLPFIYSRKQWSVWSDEMKHGRMKRNYMNTQPQSRQCALLHGRITNQSELKGGEARGFERAGVTYNIARLTVRLLLHGVEGLATQLGAAGHADEAVDMEDLVHGCAAGALTHHVLSTAGTAPWGEGGGGEEGGG